MIIFAAVLLILMFLAAFACVVAIIKNDITYRNQGIILEAIFDYKIDMIDKARKNGTIMDGVKYEVDYSDMEDYNSTLWRIFDWGYENILPSDKFEIIKPYIHK